MAHPSKGAACNEESYDGATKWDAKEAPVLQTLGLTTKLQEI